MAHSLAHIVKRVAATPVLLIATDFDGTIARWRCGPLLPRRTSGRGMCSARRVDLRRTVSRRSQAAACQPASPIRAPARMGTLRQPRCRSRRRLRPVAFLRAGHPSCCKRSGRACPKLTRTSTRLPSDTRPPRPNPQHHGGAGPTANGPRGRHATPGVSDERTHRQVSAAPRLPGFHRVDRQ